MSQFANMVRSRMAAAVAGGALGERQPSSGQAAEGTRILQHLTSTNGACAADPRCVEVWQALAMAYRGTRADARTALTRLQDLLRQLTIEDADVAGDAQIQDYRRRLHLWLDH